MEERKLEELETALTALNCQGPEAEITEDDWHDFSHLTSTDLGSEEVALAQKPTSVNPNEKEILAVHWHPEWVPLNLISNRVKNAYPNLENKLLIPTQHNKILTLGQWAGVEVDVYAPEYGMKVQLLLHLKANSLLKASTLIDMIGKTFDYRAYQLLDILKTLVEPDEKAAKKQAVFQAEVSAEAVDMARCQAAKLLSLIREAEIIGSDRDEMLKNRLLTDFISLRCRHQPQALIDQTLAFIKSVKKTVKAALKPEQFFTAREIIEEARGLGAGVVIPHPPTFWPVLLDDLDVDGWEVWNPSTPNHTVFLTKALARCNESRHKAKPLLAFMGDDIHMSAKIRPHLGEEKTSAKYEIGLQPPWQDPAAAAALKEAGQSRAKTLAEYKERLSA